MLTHRFTIKLKIYNSREFKTFTPNAMVKSIKYFKRKENNKTTLIVVDKKPGSLRINSNRIEIFHDFRSKTHLYLT